MWEMITVVWNVILCRNCYESDYPITQIADIPMININEVEMRITLRFPVLIYAKHSQEPRVIRAFSKLLIILCH